MNPILLQKQVRDNALDLQNCLKDLKDWESEMKRKESELCEENRSRVGLPASHTVDLPPVRNKLRKTEKKTKPTDNTLTANDKKISGFDYASWDRFDVDKACEQVDATTQESEEETESEEEDIETQRLRDEAIYEKEKGNQFVKNQKWTKAIECYTRAIECYPYDAIFFANRALCYLKTLDLKAAEADCTSALSLDISYVKAFLRRAAARTGLGLFEEAKSDLEKVMLLEPNNTAAKAEILKIEKEIEAHPTEKKGSFDQEKKKDEGKKQQASQGASSSLLNARSKREPTSQSAATTSNCDEEKTVSGGASKQNKPETESSSDSKGEIIHPVYKPPHLRSKNPLKEIEIKVINEGMPKKAVDLNIFQTNTNIMELQATPSQEQGSDDEMPPDTSAQLPRLNPIRPTKATPQPPATQDQQDDISNIPPPAHTYIDFYVSWNKMHLSPKRRFLYLKQIPGAALPKIFGESLESEVLSGLIKTLETSFLPSKEPVYPYLLGISNVKRLSTLTLFMNNADKTRLETLLESCERLRECSKEEVIVLRKKYEL